MKRLLLLATFAFVSFSMTAQEISEEQWSLISKKTADWCSNCGGWGWTFKNQLLEDHADKNVVFWMLHYSGGLMTPTAKAISDNFDDGGQPVFYLNNDNMIVGSSNTQAKRDEFSLIIDAVSEFVPFAGVGTTAVFDGEKITTTSKAKFLLGLEGGSYWLATYLVDDELVAFQQSQGNNAVHQNILLHSFHGDDHFGENIVSGEVMEEAEYTVEGELDFSGDNEIPDYSDGYSVVTVLWSVVNGEYTVFNLNRQPITMAVSTKDVLQDVDVSAFHLGAGQVSLNIIADQNIENANIMLYDINGRVLAGQNDVDIHSGSNQILLETSELSMGTYVVVVESDRGSRSIKVSVR